MSNTLEYILSLNDKMSSKLQKIGITSDNALDKFAKLQTQSAKTSKLIEDMGGSVGSLRSKLELLKAEKEWIPASNLKSIRAYNTEIKKLEKEINHLDTINGSVFKRNMKDAIQSMPFSNFLTNPITMAGAALFKTGQMAFKFDEGMAKINTTAQLNQEQLSKLKKELIGIGTEANADLNTVPDSFEKILSQTGDVTLSTQILKTALKGSKGGFTDLTTVSDALAQSLSLIGKENTNAQEVMDTFFAAKRVGAGEFSDFAQYMPGLIASGKALGVNFKETAGVFAYMTGKGQSAERSAVLMENAFSALGKIDVRKNLSKAGIRVFDKSGTIREMNDIFGDLQNKMKNMSDEKKSSFLAKMGLVDKEARSAFIVLSSDADKLKNTLKEVANSQGETEKAYKLSINPMDRIKSVMTKLSAIGINLGGIVSTIVIPPLEFLATIIGGASDATNWLIQKFQEGNVWVYTITGTILGLIAVMKAKVIWGKAIVFWEQLKRGWGLKNLIVTKATIFWTNAKAIADKGAAAATWLWATAQTGLNAVQYASPTTWVIAGIIALIAIIMYLVSRIDGWGKAWSFTLKAIKSGFMTFFYAMKTYALSLGHVFMSAFELIQKGWYKVKSLWDKEGAQKGLDRIKKESEARKKALIESKNKTIEEGKNTVKYSIQAGSSLKWNNDSLGDNKQKFMNMLGMSDSPAKSGIKSPKKSGVLERINPNPKDNSKDNTPLSKTNEDVVTGGTKDTKIYINFKNLVETLTVKGNEFSEATTDMERQVMDALVRVLAMAKTSI